MNFLFDQTVAPALGLVPINRDARVLARAAFDAGEIGEIDIRGSQSTNLIPGASGSGFVTLVGPSALGTRGGPPQMVVTDGIAVNAKGFARFQGIVRLANPGNTLAKGDTITIDDATAGRRIYGFALEDASGGYCSALWDGVYGFGQIMGVSVPGNDAPVADITATPDHGDAPLSVTLDAAGSTDDSAIVKYEFDYGEGMGWVDNGTDVDIVHVYTVPGTYTAAVRVTDDGTPGLQAIDTVTVVVTDPGGIVEPGSAGSGTGATGDGGVPH